MVFHPWRQLRALTHVEVFFQHLTGNRRAATDGIEVIVMRPGLAQVQRRCALAHELAHIDLGHTGGCTPQEERQASELAARWLIDLNDLIDALRWSTHLAEVADELWVDEPTLRARLDGLTDQEREQIRRGTRR